MTAMIDYVADWQTRLRGRIYEQFRGLPNLQAVSDAIAAQAQDLEDAIQSVLTITSIDDSTGEQLLALGRFVGQLYTGEDDPTYRLRIRARIAANLSSGDPEDLYAVFVAMFNLPTPGQAQVVPLPPSPAAIIFRVLLRPLSGNEVGVLFDLLTEAKVGGVRLVIEWPTVDPAGGFAMDDAGDIGDAGPGLGFSDAGTITVGGMLSGALST